MNGYCGYGDWPACTVDLATTGTDGGEYIILALVAVLFIGLGIRLVRRRRG